MAMTEAQAARAALGRWRAPDRPRSPEALLTLAASLRSPEEPVVLAALAPPRRAELAVHAAALAAWIAERRRAPGLFVVGLNGGQGSGKSTLAALTAQALIQGFSLRARVLSLDDLYLERDRRRTLSERVHPLLMTRGVPGTHDLQLAASVFDGLAAPQPSPGLRLPSFDKAVDDRRPQAEGEVVDAPTDVLLFEGWCVGARPLDEAALGEPLNELERDEDTDGRWRRYVADALAGDYQTLFSRLDALVMLAVPDFDAVRRWRGAQEARLRETRGRGMTRAEVARFVEHYERITRAQLRELPEVADLVLRLDAEQSVEHVGGPRRPPPPGRSDGVD